MTAKALAVAYLRTSSAENVGEDKDSDKRQMLAINAYAKRAGYVIDLPPYYDAVVKGADSMEVRSGFTRMLSYLADHPEIKTILVENASRFARDLIVQETGYRMLKDRGITVLPVDSPNYFAEETPTAVLIRQILGAVSQFEKSMLVSKLKGARVRKRQATGKCEGRKSHLEARPEVVTEARKLHHKNPKTGKRRSLRNIASELATKGYVSSAGKPFSASAVRSMLAQR